MNYFLVGFIAFIGSFAQSSMGFGYAIVCMALWPLLMPFRSAAVIEVFTAFVMVLYIAVKLRKHINFKLLLWPLVAAILVSNLGVYTLMISSESFLRRVLGLALILLSIYFIFFGDKLRLKPTVLTGLTAGSISGFFGGLFSIGGPPMVAYLLSATDDKLEYNATLQCFFLFTTAYVFGTHFVLGNVTATEIQFGAAALLGLGLGTFAGMNVFKRLSMPQIRKFVYIFIAAAGIYLTIRA